MVGRLLLVNLLILFVAMTVAFYIAYQKRRLDTVDVSWGIGFLVAAWAIALQVPTKRTLAAAFLVSVWGLRLAAHIYRRSKFRGDDPRYRELTRKWRGNIWVRAYFSIFLLQGGLVWIISLPVVMLSQPVLGGLTWLLYVGPAIWLCGFIFEAIADQQLQQYLRQQDRPKVMDRGLWRYSRHPNYFGELVQWWGIGLMALAVRYGWIGLIGPLTLTYLIIFVSGLPPIENKRKDDKSYQNYKRRTSAMVPLPPRAV